MAEIRAAEEKAVPGSTLLSEAVARNLFKLMAVKDEYEVARLYTDGSFERQLAAEFESFERLEFHLAPPVLGRKGPDGNPVKSSFGPRMMTGFRILAKLRAFRGTALDPFAYSEERKMERQLLADYRRDLDLILSRLSPATLAASAALASVPGTIRGYGHVKQAAAARAGEERQRLIERINSPAEEASLAAAE